MKARKKLLIAGTLALALFAGGAWFTAWANTPEVPQVAKATQAAIPQPPTVDELLRLVNEERAKVGVAPLVVDANMEKTAQWKADDMFNRNYFSHFPETMDGQPNTEQYTVNNEMRGYLRRTCVESGENITDNIRINNSISAINAWKGSKPHYEAMIDPKYNSTGFGISGTKVVQHFCVAI